MDFNGIRIASGFLAVGYFIFCHLSLTVMDSGNLSAWGEVLLFLIGGLAFVLVALLTSRLIRPNRPNPEKLEPYESGEQPVGSAWIQFHVRFYIIALIFLLFEIEIVFLFPWATVFADKKLIEGTNGMWGWFSFTEMIIFVGVLALGLIYAWAKGFLDWIKPEPKATEFKSPVPKEFYDKVNEQYGRK